MLLSAELIARLAPAVTIFGETAIALLFLTKRTARLGVALALLLHLGIALTPPPIPARVQSTGRLAGSHALCVLLREC